MRRSCLWLAGVLAAVAMFAQGAVYFQSIQQLRINTGTPSLTWYFQQIDYATGAKVTETSGVGSSSLVTIYWSYTDRFYGLAFYDYSLGRFFSIMYTLEDWL